MSDVGQASAVLLAALFAWAGAAKLLDRGRTTKTFAAFGLPAPHVLGIAVPGVELLLALGLLVIPALAAYLALGLLVAFTTFLLRAVRAGIDVGCGCFGSARSAPVSSVEVLRNGFLAGAAVAASFATGPGVPGLRAILLVGAAAGVAAAVVAVADQRRSETTGRLAGPGGD